MKEFLLSLQEVYKKYDKKLKILTEGSTYLDLPKKIIYRYELPKSSVYTSDLPKSSVYTSEFKSGSIHTATIFLRDAISTDLRLYLIDRCTSENPGIDLSHHKWYKKNYSNNDKNILRRYYEYNAINLIQDKYSFLPEQTIQYYLNKGDINKIYETNHYHPLMNPIIEVTALSLISHLNKNTNLVYYAHWGHIEPIKKYIKEFYDKTIYVYDSGQYDGKNYIHCLFGTTQRECQSEYLMNLTPNAYLPFKDDTYFNTLIKDYYEKTKIRKKLD